MSWSSSAASTPGFHRAAGRSGDESRSQVRCRENPMCHCNPPREAPRWISWSRQNPGRRYYCCVDAMVRINFALFFFCVIELFSYFFSSVK
uniref:Uncharacterized protein n=1 Tax=Aegilops tauschii subsp. strangulata TaxID=200361 RepID=A0A453QC44_AEGTS